MELAVALVDAYGHIGLCFASRLAELVRGGTGNLDGLEKELGEELSAFGGADAMEPVREGRHPRFREDDETSARAACLGDKLAGFVDRGLAIEEYRCGLDRRHGKLRELVAHDIPRFPTVDQRCSNAILGRRGARRFPPASCACPPGRRLRIAYRFGLGSWARCCRCEGSQRTTSAYPCR